MEPGCWKEGEAETNCDEEKRWAVELHCLEQLLDALFYGSGTSSGKTPRVTGSCFRRPTGLNVILRASTI
jgi:hypothetical protein